VRVRQEPRESALDLWKSRFEGGLVGSERFRGV